ncbi:MAG: DUF454 domain-containing protein [Dehalococcoidales bacterium]|jgi:uncharacterized membrane protein YbaN (DUF454 family)|nr:DUF454 domain-containing protein [Dehalococcoidales bacterium]
MQDKNEIPSDRECPEVKGWLRYILIIIGTICVGLGMLGMFLPVLPTTPFLLLAAACYIRSSRRFYCWLINNRFCGKYIQNYRQKKGIPLKLKISVISLLWLTILASAIFIVDLLLVRILLILIAVGVTIHLLKIRTLKG